VFRGDGNDIGRQLPDIIQHLQQDMRINDNHHL